MDRIRLWLRIASHPSVLRRSIVTCLLVGAILVAINHGGALLRGRVDPAEVVQMVVTFVVPFVISTVSSVAAIEGYRADNGQGGPFRPRRDGADPRERRAGSGRAP